VIYVAPQPTNGVSQSCNLTLVTETEPYGSETMLRTSQTFRTHLYYYVSFPTHATATRKCCNGKML